MNEKRFELLLPNAIINDTIVRKSYYLSEKDDVEKLVGVLNEQQNTINKQEEIIKSQDMEISRQYNLCLAMSGVLREEFGVYDVFDRTKDRKIE